MMNPLDKEFFLKETTSVSRTSLQDQTKSHLEHSVLNIREKISKLQTDSQARTSTPLTLLGSFKALKLKALFRRLIAILIRTQYSLMLRITLIGSIRSLRKTFKLNTKTSNFHATSATTSKF